MLSTHLIRPVIVLRVVFEYLGLFMVIKISHEIIDLEVFAPLFAVHEPGTCQSDGQFPPFAKLLLRTFAWRVVH